jgi:hypothetical protein
MDGKAWNYLFGGLAAVAGIAALYIMRSQGSQQPVTNVFPPLNTTDPVSTATETLPNSGTPATAGQSGKDSSGLTPYPVYIV